ncbi:NgoFVII family restriction endonuclease [Chromatium weissei]|nr:NgoFVII family restriction endonuclease [Chromatium weissei]
MPRIFDNINQDLLPTLLRTLESGERADCCVGYFNLRGWRQLAAAVGRWAGGEGHCCRLLIGMQSTPSDELRLALRLGQPERRIDNQTVVREKRRLAEDFRQQLTFGVPTNADEATLRQLARQLRARQLIVKVHLRYPLHAKLYLVYRTDANNPITGFVGSSNLTFAGLQQQGELNLDVVDHDACDKLAHWFEDRWRDRWCFDLSNDLATIIEESWAAEPLVSPYHVYLRMAWFLAQDVRVGMAEFRIPALFHHVLLDFQAAAVQTAARHLNQRGGVLLGDVVGLGKSLMATALAKIFEDDHGTETLIICPKNLVTMWEHYAHRYQLCAKVLSLSRVLNELPEKTRRYRVVLIDESHNLRNKDGQRWRVIRDYIERNDSRVILLSATPYNKNYRDLSAQLALFLKEDTDLGIRPERLLAAHGGEAAFKQRHQCSVHSLAAFEKSDDADDWQDLMRLYLVRRTRSFIMQHYAKTDERGRYLQFPDGSKSYFPQRIPQNVRFSIDDTNANDPYARLYSESVVNSIAALRLPRYGLKKYLIDPPPLALTVEQEEIIKDLSRAGTRLMGFCRTNLFKRLESAGPAFLQSIERHILRNFSVLHALAHGLDIPLGTQDAVLLDGDEEEIPSSSSFSQESWGNLNLKTRAAAIDTSYRSTYRKRFRWLPSALFKSDLTKDLEADALALLNILTTCGNWNPAHDTKLAELTRLITEQHSKDKLLIFTQFADTAEYLAKQLQQRGVTHLAVATGQSADPTALARRFSPISNETTVTAANEVRVLIATDVLSEGQNLQDCSIIVNYDLPWAIIRLIQRAGRVDRIGQQADCIRCYSFVPADGVERILKLRQRVRERLNQNAEVVGSDELFFDDEIKTRTQNQALRDLYTEKTGVLDADDDGQIDLASYAFQIWKNATAADSSLITKIENLPAVVYATKAHQLRMGAPTGVLVYTRTPQGNDALAWIDETGTAVTQAQLTILKAAECTADSEALPRLEQHHALTAIGIAHILKEEQRFGGALGRANGARARAYERLKNYRINLSEQRDLLITNDDLHQMDRTLETLLRYPLFQSAMDTLNRQLRTGITDENLVTLLLNLHRNERLCVIHKSSEQQEPQLICTLGLCANHSSN